MLSISQNKIFIVSEAAIVHLHYKVSESVAVLRTLRLRRDPLKYEQSMLPNFILEVSLHMNYIFTFIS